MRDSNHPSRTELASKEDYEQARDRGSRNGCTGVFLDLFIDTELRFMQKWQYGTLAP